MKAPPDLLALLLFCAAAVPTAPAQAPGPGGGPPPPPPPRGFGPDSRERPVIPVPLPAAVQPTAQVLSALTPEQKTAGFLPNVRVSVAGGQLVVLSDGLPNHETDNFPTNYNPNRILRQNYVFHIPLAPKFAEKPTKLPFGPIGVAINGIPFYNPYNREGRDAVMGPNAEVFDSCCGHPDQLGRYHYHKFPICVRSPFASSATGHSALIGWAFDGFAIYGPNGENGQPPTDLDECNGHIDAERGYHYHVSLKFPYVLGAYKGLVEMSNFPGPQVWGRAATLTSLSGARLALLPVGCSFTWFARVGGNLPPASLPMTPSQAR